MQDEMMSEIESRHPKYLVGIWAQFSWLAQAQSDDRILIWLARYTDRCYDPAQTMGALLTVFVRKNDALCSAGAEPPPFDNQPLSYERLETYRKVRSLEPTLPDRLIVEARARADKGDVAGTVAYFAEVVRFDPGSAPAHYNLAVALTNLHRSPEAIAELREALRLDPSLADAHSNLANLLGKAGQLDEALIEIMTAVRLQPTRPDFHFNAAIAFYQRRDLPHTLEQLKAVLAIDANFAPARQMYDQLTKGR
jgi:tetratricopeptide (TPR) repeat protein